MKKIDATVLKETGYIAICTALCSALMQAVFLLIGQWDYTVLFGNLVGFLAAVGNFFLLGLTVQTVVTTEEKQGQHLMKLSQVLRFLLLFVVALVGCLVPVFHTVAVIVPYLFPRIAIALRPVFIRE